MLRSDNGGYWLRNGLTYRDYAKKWKELLPAVNMGSKKKQPPPPPEEPKPKIRISLKKKPQPELPKAKPKVSDTSKPSPASKSSSKPKSIGPTLDVPLYKAKPKVSDTSKPSPASKSSSKPKSMGPTEDVPLPKTKISLTIKKKPVPPKPIINTLDGLIEYCIDHDIKDEKGFYETFRGRPDLIDQDSFETITPLTFQNIFKEVWKRKIIRMKDSLLPEIMDEGSGLAILASVLARLKADNNEKINFIYQVFPEFRQLHAKDISNISITDLLSVIREKIKGTISKPIDELTSANPEEGSLKRKAMVAERRKMALKGKGIQSRKFRKFFP